MGLSSAHIDTVPTVNAAYYLSQGIAENQGKSEQAFSEAQSLLNGMQGLVDSISGIPIINAELGNVSSTVSGFIKPLAPVDPGIETSFPTAPGGPSTGYVGSLELSDAPVFSAVEPTIREVTPPTAFTETAPAEPSLADHDLPVKPDNTLPTAPTQRELTLPTAPSILPITFDGVVPGALGAPPSATFNWANEAFQNDLNDTLQTQLLSLVANARQTGLLPTIEAQIWARGRERTNAEAVRRRAGARRQFAALGWNMPQGDEALLMMKAEEDAVNDDITESRSIAIAQAELEQKNFQFSIQSAIGLVGQLIDLHNAEQQRLFEAARYTIEAAIGLYGLEVQYFNANVSMYETQARVYQARLQAQLNEVEIFKAQLEGQRLISDLNKQDIEIYRAKIDAVLATFELYKTELEGVKVLLEGDSLKIQRFEALVRAYAEKVRAKSLENETYKTQLDGENIKVAMYSGLATAFRSRIEGFKAETDAKVAKQESDIKIAYDVPLKISEQETEIYKSMIQAESEKLKSLTSIFETRGRVYESEVKGEVGRVEAEVNIQENEIKKLVADANIKIEAMKANVSTLLAEKEMVIGIQKTIAQVEAQLAAAYGSAVHYGASVSGSANFSDSHSLSHSYSESTTV